MKPRIPAGWKRPVSARDERTGWLVVLVVFTLVNAVAWWRGRPLDLVAAEVGLTAIGLVAIAVVAEIVRRRRQRRESK